MKHTCLFLAMVAAAFVAMTSSKSFSQSVFVRYLHDDSTIENFGPFAVTPSITLDTIARPITAEVSTVSVWVTPSTADVPAIIATATRSTALAILICNPAGTAQLPADPSSTLPAASLAGRHWGGMFLSGDLMHVSRLVVSISGDVQGSVRVGQVFRMQSNRASGAAAGGRIQASIEAMEPNDPVGLWQGRAIEFIALSHGTSATGTIAAPAGSIGTIQAISTSGASIGGMITADVGSIGTISVPSGSINIADGAGIRCRDGILLLSAREIASNITCNQSGTGGLRRMQVTGSTSTQGGFSGTLKASTIGEAGGSTSATGIAIQNNSNTARVGTVITTGDLLSEISCTGNQIAALNITIGGNLLRNITAIRTNPPTTPSEIISSITVLGDCVAPSGSSIPPAITATGGTIGPIDLRGKVPLGTFGGTLAIVASSIASLRLGDDAFVALGSLLLVAHMPFVPPTAVAVPGGITAVKHLAGKLFLAQPLSGVSVAGDCSAGLIFCLEPGETIPPISIGGAFSGVISLGPTSYPAPDTTNVPPIHGWPEPERALQSLVVPLGMNQQNDALADFDGIITIPIRNTNIRTGDPQNPITTGPRGASVSLWNSSGIAHGHLSSRPPDADRPRPIGGGAFGVMPYTLHAADCSPRPVPGQPPQSAYVDRPFSPLFTNEEPCDSQISRGNNPAWMPDPEPIVMRFDGPVRSTLSAGDSPVRIDIVTYVNNTAIFTRVPQTAFAVTVKRPGDAGIGRELSILGRSGFQFAFGLYRVTLNPDFVNPLVCDCVPPCPSTLSSLPPVRAFQYYFNLQADCGQDGIPGPAMGPGCVCDYFTNCAVADFNQDGGRDGGDISAFFSAWEAGDDRADTNSDGGVDGQDIATFFCWWEVDGCG